MIAGGWNGQTWTAGARRGQIGGQAGTFTDRVPLTVYYSYGKVLEKDGDDMAIKRFEECMTAKQIRDRLSADDLDRVAKAWFEFQGSLPVFESAIGAYFLGRVAGYDVLRVVHKSGTLRLYERILGIKFRDVCEAITPDSVRVNAVWSARKFSQFWKALGAGVASEPRAKEAVKG